MRRRSITGPLVLLLVGGLFLWNNLYPEAPIFDMVARYWPFLLIGWGLLRLVEIAFSRDRRLAGFSGGEVVLIVLICIAGSALWQAHQRGIRFTTGGVQMFGEQFDYAVSAKAPATGIVRVTLDNPRGNIRVIGADTQEVSVTGRKTIRAWARKDADATHEKARLEIVSQGDRLVIRTNQEHAPENQRISDDLEVTVPRAVAVEARGSVADYEVTDVSGDVELASDRADVRLARVGGNVRLDIGRSELIRAADVKGKMEVQGSRGTDLDLENIEGQVTVNGTFTGSMDFKKLAKPLVFEGSRSTELRVHAIPGRLTMDLSEVSGDNLVGPIRLVTRSRDIKLAGFTQSLDLVTERGDVQLHPSLPVPQIEARSGLGRIELILPPKAAFDLQATAERGEASNDFGPEIRQERVNNTSTLTGKVGNGPLVRLTATRGSVTVRKEGDVTGEAPDSGKESPARRNASPRDLKESEVKM